jgi:hypothetical protein
MPTARSFFVTSGFCPVLCDRPFGREKPMRSFFVRFGVGFFVGGVLAAMVVRLGWLWMTL